MTVSRRTMIAGAGLALGLPATASAGSSRNGRGATALDARDLGIEPNSDAVQTGTLQRGLERSALSGEPLFLPPGRYRTATLELPPGAGLIGVPDRSILELEGAYRILAIADAHPAQIEGIVFDGRFQAGGNGSDRALLYARNVDSLSLFRCAFVNGGALGISLSHCGGRIDSCTFDRLKSAALFALDSTGLVITGNTVRDCGDNGILVWRSEKGEDGSLISDNRIARIRADSGGMGQNGNGINVFRAAAVTVSGNRITDCAFTAVRGNAADNLGIIGNSCARIGEVALYAEFEFEGVVISNNTVDDAAMGVSITNYGSGGRLGVCSGNLIRNIKTTTLSRESRGIGIGVEADVTVTGNVVENAAYAGITAGWGRYLNDVVISANVVRNSPLGIAVSVSDGIGKVLVAQNMISGASRAALAGYDHDVIVIEDLATSPDTPPSVTVSGNVT